MSFKNFVTPHCHQMSLDTASTPEAFAKRELELGTGYLTVTDHGTLGCCRQVYDLAQKKKLTPILGLEAYFRDDDCPILAAAGIPKVEIDDGPNKGKLGFQEYLKYYHLTMHFLDQAAYETGVRLLSNAQLNHAEKPLYAPPNSETKPMFHKWEVLEELGAQNTVFTSGCLIGMVQRHLLADRLDLAEAYYKRLRSIVKPGNFAVEIFPHRCDKNWVNAAFFTLEDGRRIRFYSQKKLRINDKEMNAEQAANLFVSEKNGGAPLKLQQVSHYRKWEDVAHQYGEDIPLPLTIVKAEFIKDFVANECRPWSPDGDVQAGANRVMRYFAGKYGDPIIISDDSHYATPDEKIIQDVRLINSSNGKDTFRFYGHYHRQSSEEAFAYFREHMDTSEAEFEGWIDNGYAWASKFKGFKLQNRQSLPTSFYPSDTLMHTKTLIDKHRRMDWTNTVYVERLKSEIDLLHHNGTIDLLPYFFIDEEVCSLYERNGLLTGPGRGSAAGLLLTYLLGITHVDPIRYQLSRDRFITLDRIAQGKLPDIDQDLPSRDLLVGQDGKSGWLSERFVKGGKPCYAQISTDTTMKLRSAIKDVYRAMYGNISPEINKLCGKMPDPPQGISDREFVFGYKGPEGWIEGLILKDGRVTDPALDLFIKQYPKVWEKVTLCLGLVRQKGRHACAYAICDYPIDEYVPIEITGEVPVTGYTAPSVESAGVLKMDFLVITSLLDVAGCLKLVQQRFGGDQDFTKDFLINGRRVPGMRIVVDREGNLHDVWDLPEDQRVFREICEGKTETVFQFGTPGAQQWLAQFNHETKKVTNGVQHKALDSIDALSAFTALDRPGPLDAKVGEGDNAHNMLVEFAVRARGGIPTGVVPILDKLLPDTHGIIVFQEQLQRIFHEIGQTTALQANDFRTDISKKKMAKVLEAKPIFMKGAVTTLGQEQAEAMWDMMVTFGQYGFNRSHSTCYVVLGYACAWLKHHYPLEWWCAVLRNADRNEIDKEFWRFCGHLIRLPDLRTSRPQFEIVDDKIVAPLWLLHGIGPKAHEQLVAGSPYKDVDDFCQKIEEHRRSGATMKEAVDKKTNNKIMKRKLGKSAITKAVLESLLVSGSMESLYPPGTPLMEQTSLLDAARSRALQDSELHEAALAKRKPKNKKVAAKDLMTTRLAQMNQFIEYQMRKSVLPAWSKPIMPMLTERHIDGVFMQPVEGLGDVCYFRDNVEDGGTVDYRFVSAKEVGFLSRCMLPDGKPIEVVVAAYVIDSRRFKYGPEKEREAEELILEIDGLHFKFVKWPDRKTGKLPPGWPDKLKGAIVVALLNRYAEDKPFAIEGGSVMVVQPALDDNAESDDDDEKEDKENAEQAAA